MAYMFKLS